MELRTRRLRLVPMSLTQLDLAQVNITAAMLPFQYDPPPRAALNFLRKVMRAKAQLMREEPSAWLLCTYFLIVHTETDIVMGEVGMKGPPLGDGSVEIGYGLQPPYQNQGYMTEAVTALCRFVFTQTAVPVASITASTQRDNHASRRVLEKCGFVWEKRPSHLFWWRLYPSRLTGESNGQT